MWADLYDPSMHDRLPSSRGVYPLEELVVEHSLRVVGRGEGNDDDAGDHTLSNTMVG
jgi:hypothetical protein